MREAPAPDVGRVVEERAAIRRELDVVQVVRRRRPRVLRRTEHKRLLGLVIIVVWQRERVMRAAVDKTVQFVVRVRVERRRLRLGLERPRGRVGIEHVARGRDEQLQARLAAL